MELALLSARPESNQNRRRVKRIRAWPRRDSISSFSGAQIANPDYRVGRQDQDNKRRAAYSNLWIPDSVSAGLPCHDMHQM